MTTSAPTHAPSRRRRSKPTTRRHCPPSTSSFHPPPRRTHRAYGLPNANQILLAVVTLGMLCYQLIRSDWIQFDGIDGGAGLLGLQLTGVNDTTISMPWSEYCYTINHTISLPMAIPRYTQPINPSLAQSICDSSTISVVRGLTITCIALSLVSIVIALYLHFGTPSRREMVWWGIVPGISLFSCAIMGTIALQQWQNTFAHVNIGDCFGVAIASVVIAYITSISMVLRWRWPGVCMVPTEQQAFEARTHQVPRIIRETIPPPSTGGGTLYEEPERDRSSFHQIV